MAEGYRQRAPGRRQHPRTYDVVMAISEGSKVSWNTPQGKTSGKAVEKKTKEFTFKGHKFKASDDDPYWVVESESGKQAAHKESSLSADQS